MATLTISSTSDYRSETLLNIDIINFTATAVGSFLGSQFSPGFISENLVVTGDAGTNDVLINVSGTFTLSGWTFSTWTTADTITLSGDATADTITGSSQSDIVFAGAGQDTVNGGDGSDALVANTLENLFAQEHDTLSGGNGNDTLYGEAVDTLSGGAGFDVLQVINAYDMNLNLVTTSLEYVVSDFGNDTYTAVGSATSVEVYGSGGNDTITGGSGDDRLWGGVGNDTLVGGDGNDVLVGDLGADSLSGGMGSDVLYIDSDDTFIDGGASYDIAYIATGSGITLNMATSHLEWVADFAGGNDSIDASGMNQHVFIYAGSGSDTIVGSSGGGNLWGMSGDDFLTGGSLGEWIVGGEGADTLRGGGGSDNLYGNGGSGGDGAVDIFVFDTNWAEDAYPEYVFDFEVGIDKLDMTLVAGVTGFSDLTVTSQFGNAMITFGNERISVAGVGGQLTASDFLFV